MSMVGPDTDLVSKPFMYTIFYFIYFTISIILLIRFKFEYNSRLNIFIFNTILKYICSQRMKMNGILSDLDDFLAPA